MLELVSAPTVRTRSKVRRTDADVARAIIAAGEVWRQSWPIPLVIDGRCEGLLGYEAKTDRSWLLPVARCASQTIYDTYSEGTADRLAAGGNYAIHWHKRADGRAAGTWYDTWAASGRPAAGSYGGTARTAKQYDRSSVGANAVPSASPARRSFTRQSQFSNAGLFLVTIPYDRVLTYESCTMSASSQNMTNSLTAQRHISSGPGLKLSIWADAVQNATAANLTAVSYTNVAGTSAQLAKTTPTLTKTVTLAAPSVAVGSRNVFSPVSVTARPFLEIADGDAGMAKVDSFQWSAAPTGTCAFVLSWPYHLQIATMGGSSSVGICMATDEDLLSGFVASADLTIPDDACIGMMVYTRVNGGELDYGYLGTSVSS